jgi:hypothetical protein
MMFTLSSISYSLLLASSYLASSAKAQECFSSTLAILMAQTQNPPVKDIVLCPDTTIDIGLPANAEFTEFVGGDYPLTILHDEVTIRCGEDGSSSNNCSLNGGFVQLVATPNNPFFPTQITTNNLMVQGLTFKGTLTGVSGLLSSAVALGTPGENMVFDDCVFEGLISDQVMFNGRDGLSSPEDMPPMSSIVTIKNSTFRNITYKYRILLSNLQTMNLENSKFENLKYGDCDCNNAAVVQLDDAKMDMKDCSFDDVEFFASVVYARGNETDFTFSGNTATDLKVFDQENRDENDYCEEGLIIEKITNGMFDLCVELFEQTETPVPSPSPSLRPTTKSPIAPTLPPLSPTLGPSDVSMSMDLRGLRGFADEDIHVEFGHGD